MQAEKKIIFLNLLYTKIFVNYYLYDYMYFSIKYSYSNDYYFTVSLNLFYLNVQTYFFIC
jgi:hypothetical protein